MTENPVIQKSDAGGAVCAYARGGTRQQPNQTTDGITIQHCRDYRIADESLQRLSQSATRSCRRNIIDSPDIRTHHFQNTAIHNTLVRNSANVTVATR
jgi:hypothetical protein